jgi:hypothetical protein
MSTQKCDQCGQTCHPTCIDNGVGHFCSPECRDVYMSHRSVVTASVTEISDQPIKLSEGEGHA